MKIARIVLGILLLFSALGLLAIKFFAPGTYESTGEIIYLVTVLPLAVFNYWVWVWPEEVKTWWREGLPSK
jgi:hypothetical protein